MRLNHFLRFHRKQRGKRITQLPDTRLYAFFSRLLPASWTSDAASGRKGKLRKTLKRLGPVWAAAPLRRIIQTLCLIAFVILFCRVLWPYDVSPQFQEGVWPSHYADNLADKSVIAPEVFLIIDPLVALSTAIAAKSWVWSLSAMAVILIICFLIPRGFCGYLCPLGTTIDVFDWLIGKRVTRFRVKGDGWWVNLKYYLLAGLLVSSFGGVLLTGIFAAIPVITRAMLFIVAPLQTGIERDWYLIPSMNAGHYVSIGLFVVVLGLGLLRKRFWCRYVCPSGAIFSVFNIFRVSERKVEDTCVQCNKCVEICPFDAIKADFTTRTPDCTMCQSCGGVCPTHSIKFVDRWDSENLKEENDPPVNEIGVSRRGFITGSAAAVATVASMKIGLGADIETIDPKKMPVRPPGSVPEKEFLQLCIRCGECFAACPNNVLQPQGFKQGLEGVWAPEVIADWAGCESSCNACGQVCPTGAIRDIPLEEKKVARMGLAEVNLDTCLPAVGEEACDLCIQECNAAGYEALLVELHGVKTDDDGFPIEGTGFEVPVVDRDLCVGCGLCQTRCHRINVTERGVLDSSAIVIYAGEDREDRFMQGSYIEAREQRQSAKAKTLQELNESRGDVDAFYIPD